MPAHAGSVLERQRIEVEGTVCSGLGQGQHFTQLDWVLVQLRAQLGWSVHPGTLNLRLSGPRWDALRRAMQASPGLPIEPPAGFCAAKCFRAELGEQRLPAAVVLPEVAAYPAQQLELVAPLRLRDALGLDDGASLRLTVEV